MLASHHAGPGSVPRYYISYLPAIRAALYLSVVSWRCIIGLISQHITTVLNLRWPDLALDLTQRQEVYLSVLYGSFLILLTQFNSHHILENTVYDLETGMYCSKKYDGNREEC
jgi:hypothetical protein